MYLNNLFIFTQFGKNFFILPAVKNKFLFIRTKYFLALIFYAVSFDDNMSNSVGSLVM